MYKTDETGPGIFRRLFYICVLCALCPVFFLASCDGGDSSDASPEPEPTAEPVRAGGDTSVYNRTSFAFEVPASNLSEESLIKHLNGDITFGDVFVTPPAPRNPGLGPLFNNVSCESCHVKNGRGQPVFGNTGLRSHGLIRISDPEGTPLVPGGNRPVEGLGEQIQDHATFGFEPEGEVLLEWEEAPGTYPDGTPYSLRRPIIDIMLPDGESLPSNIQTSMRVPPPVIGLGLLEAISEETILERADPDDADGDGISGRPNMVWNTVTSNFELGRFGHKASSHSLREQAVKAYFEDMGVTNPDLPGEDPEPDIDEETVELTTFYTQTLAVPLRLDTDDPDVPAGERIFNDIGCEQCHRSVIRTGTHELPELSDQLIQPFTDLLLHDMGEGLADHRPDHKANGMEWRTPPLWAIGLTKTVAGVQNFLHDGRARTLEEAILWHDGEAHSAKERFMNLNKTEREKLIKFLNAL
ncbi:MAG: di-heme oxidoredictase family protein [Candidatus Dadabacteria bacterium]